eukprot:362478-Chlamydomonas_euryale.AAC.12
MERLKTTKVYSSLISSNTDDGHYFSMLANMTRDGCMWKVSSHGGYICACGHCVTGVRSNNSLAGSLQKAEVRGEVGASCRILTCRGPPCNRGHG